MSCKHRLEVNRRALKGKTTDRWPSLLESRVGAGDGAWERDGHVEPDVTSFQVGNPCYRFPYTRPRVLPNGVNSKVGRGLSSLGAGRP